MGPLDRNLLSGAPERTLTYDATSLRDHPLWLLGFSIPGVRARLWGLRAGSVCGGTRWRRGRGTMRGRLQHLLQPSRPGIRVRHRAQRWRLNHRGARRVHGGRDRARKPSQGSQLHRAGDLLSPESARADSAWRRPVCTLWPDNRLAFGQPGPVSRIQESRPVHLRAANRGLSSA